MSLILGLIWRSRRSDSGSRLVLPTTGHENNITHVSATLVNPFTAGLLITRICSTVSTHGILLGIIGTSTNFTLTGKSTAILPNLDLELNMDPAALFTVTRLYAVSAGLSTEQLDGIVQLGGYRYLQATDGNSSSVTKRKRDNMYTYVMYNRCDFYHDLFAVDSIFRTSYIQHLNSCTLTYSSKQMCRLVSATFSSI